MAYPREFEPPANSLGSYSTCNKINNLLVTRHMFATSIQRSTLFWCYMTQSAQSCPSTAHTAKQGKGNYSGRPASPMQRISDLPALAVERGGSTLLRHWPLQFGASAT